MDLKESMQQIEDKVKETYASVYAYFQSLTPNETYGWMSIGVGMILVIIGLLML